MINTISNKIINIYKNKILVSKELVLKNNKGLRLNGSNVEWWSYPENGWFFKAPSGKEPTFNTTENAVEFTNSSEQFLRANKNLRYDESFIFQTWINFKNVSILQSILAQRDYPSDSANYLNFLLLQNGYLALTGERSCQLSRTWSGRRGQDRK